METRYLEELNIFVSKNDLLKILAQNQFQAQQIKELQQALTLKEEQLRAYRRISLSDSQAISLKKDLEETTNAVVAMYAPRLDPPPPPKTKSGEFLVVCPSCADKAKTLGG